MADVIEFLDPEVITEPPGGYNEPLPITLGPSWQPNDIRLVFFSFVNFYQGPSPSYTLTYYGPQPFPPADFTVGTDPWSTQGHNGSVCWKRLTASDVDNRSVSWVARYWRFLSVAMVTARGVDPGVNPTFFSPGSTAGYATQLNSPARGQVATMTLPGAGALAVYLSGAQGDGTWGTPLSPTLQQIPVTGSGFGVPSGWKAVAASPQSGDNFYQYAAGTNAIVIAKMFAAGGATGTITLPASYASGPVVDGQVDMRNHAVYLKPATATVITAAAGATIDHTYTSGTVVTTAAAACVAGATDPIVHTGTRGYNPLYGTVATTLLLPGDAVRSSLIEWDSTGPPILFETSINNGLSWDVATSGTRVPRLYGANNRARKLLVRGTLTRATTADTKPVLRKLRVRVRTDSGWFEYTPIGHGAINKSKVEITAGLTGGSGGSGGSGGVKARGGGMTGNGHILKIHAVDLSRHMKLAGWEQPHVVTVGENVVTAAVNMAKDRIPWLTKVSTVSTDRVVEGSPLVFGLDQKQDPWQDFQEFLMSIAYQGFFEPDGTLRVQPVPDPRYVEPVWTFSVDSRTISKIVRELDDEMVRNRIVVEGENTATKNPIVATAQDDDPTSSTRINGRLGIRTERAKFPHINNQDQLNIAALGILYNSLSLMDTVTITVPPIYILEPGDCVRVECPQVNVGANFIIQSMTTPLSPAEPMELVLFRQMTTV